MRELIVDALGANSEDPSSILEPTWWKERGNSCKLFSEHTFTVTFTYTRMHTRICLHIHTNKYKRKRIHSIFLALDSIRETGSANSKPKPSAHSHHCHHHHEEDVLLKFKERPF